MQIALRKIIMRHVYSPVYCIRAMLIHLYIASVQCLYIWMHMENYDIAYEKTFYKKVFSWPFWTLGGKRSKIPFVIKNTCPIGKTLFGTKKLHL